MYSHHQMSHLHVYVGTEGSEVVQVVELSGGVVLTANWEMETYHVTFPNERIAPWLCVIEDELFSDWGLVLIEPEECPVELLDTGEYRIWCTLAYEEAA